MKKVLALLAVLTVAGIAAPTVASAYDDCYHRRVVSYLPCGRPVYAVYEVCGHDRYGRPHGRWVTQHSSCGCGVCRPRHYSSHRGHHHHSHRPALPVPPHHRAASFFFSFGR